MTFARVGALRPASTLCSLSAGALLASTTSIAFQDMTALLSDVPPAERWQSHMVAAPQGSVHAATYQPSRIAATGSLGIHVPALPQGGIVAIAQDEGAIGEGQPPVVIRATKGDLQMTRTPVAEPNREIPASGKVWDLKDIFSAHDEANLPKVAFAAPDRRPFAAIMVAYSSFTRPGADSPADGAAAVMVADAIPTAKPDVTGAAPVAGTFSLAAYAPADATIEAPFDALMGAAPSVMPKQRPASVLGWLNERKRMKAANGKAHAWLANPLPRQAFNKTQQDCLARGIYFEARGESELGQAGVGQVILNRVRNPAYPGTICGVVYQNKKWRNRCQFSFACDGIRDRVRSARAWKTAQKVAKAVSSGEIWLDEVGDSTHYHAAYVRPRWARKMKKTDKIGRHIFYRTKGGGWS
jgi:spore germination cell wall hydrolase CwlJ-like protein